MATGDQTWTKLAIGAAIAVKMGAVYVDIKQTQAFFEEGFEGNPKLVKFVFAMTDDGTAKRESTIAQNNFWIATYMTTVNVGMVSVLVLVVPTVKRVTGYQLPLVSVAMALWMSAFAHLNIIDANRKANWTFDKNKDGKIDGEEHIMASGAWKHDTNADGYYDKDEHGVLEKPIHARYLRPGMSWDYSNSYLPDEDHDNEAEGYQHDEDVSNAREKYTKGGEVLKVTRAKSSNAHVNQFHYGFDPANVSNAAEDAFARQFVFPETPRPEEGLRVGVLVPVAAAAIVLGMTKVQWYDRVLVPLYNGGSYSGVLTKSYVAMAADGLLLWGAAYVSMYGVEQMVRLWQGGDGPFIPDPPMAPGGQYKWEHHLEKEEREDIRRENM